MKKLITRSCEEIMTTVYKPIEFVIDGLLAQGLYILAGAPKVGVGLSIILDTIIKKFDRRKPFEGTHRTVVCST